MKHIVKDPKIMKILSRIVLVFIILCLAVLLKGCKKTQESKKATVSTVFVDEEPPITSVSEDDITEIEVEEIEDEEEKPQKKEIIYPDMSMFNDYVFNLFYEADNGSKDNGFIISPVSAMYSMAALSEGAVNSTLIEIENILGQEKDYYEGKLNQYNKNTPPELTFNGSVWISEGAGFEADKEYKKTVKNKFNTDIFNMINAEELNKWVKDNSKETDVFTEEIKSGTSLYSVNITGFSAKWEDRMVNSVSGNFITEKDNKGKIYERETEFMEGTAERYYEDDHVTGIDKSYDLKDENGDKRDIRLILLLPKEAFTVDQCVEYYKEQGFNIIDKSTEDYKLKIQIPAFDNTMKNDQSYKIRHLGAESLFKESANLKRMGDSTKKIYCTDMFQKCYFSIEQEGSLIGAQSTATGKEIVHDKELVFNKPFIFILYDFDCNIAIYTGVVRDTEVTE